MRINISLDDVSPHRLAGLDAVNRMADLLVDFPDMKVSLFVPTAMRRFKDGEKKHALLSDFPAFIDGIKALPQGNFEICYHGHSHGNKRPLSNNDEFRHLNEAETYKRFQRCSKEFELVGLKPRPIFRPPGFWLSASAFVGCKRFGIKVLALHKAKRYWRIYKEFNRKYDKIVYVGGQLNGKKEKEILFHATKKQPDFFDQHQFKNLKKTLKNQDSEFIFLEEFYG